MNILDSIQAFARSHRDFPRSAATILGLLSEGLVPRTDNVYTDLFAALKLVRAAKLPSAKVKGLPDQSPWETVMQRIAALYDEAQVRPVPKKEISEELRSQIVLALMHHQGGIQ